MSLVDAIHLASFFVIIWGAYFIDRNITRRMNEVLAQRRAMREAILLAQYGAKEEAIELLNENFKD